MMYPRYQLKPFSEHIDSGFGAMADSFIEAAEGLEERDTSLSDIHLPIGFLYRHAIELYLKSIIMIIHATLKIPFGEQSDMLTVPQIYKFKEKKWVLITDEHNIGDLYFYFKHLVSSNKDTMMQIAETDWSKIPPELDHSIEKINQFDPHGTAFRYPSLKSKHKSMNDRKAPWKKANKKIKKRPLAQHNNKPPMVFIEVNSKGELESLYKYEDDILDEVLKATKMVAHKLSGAHIGIREEISPEA